MLLPPLLVSSVILVQSASLGLPFLISATKRQRIGRCGQEVKEAAASVLRGHHHIVSCLGVILASQMLSFCSNIKTLILFTICKLSREVKPYTITLAEPYYSSLFYLHICHVCISIRKYVLIYRSKVTLGGEEISFNFSNYNFELIKGNVLEYFCNKLLQSSICITVILSFSFPEWSMSTQRISSTEMSSQRTSWSVDKAIRKSMLYTL